MLYYEPPTDDQFNEVKQKAIEIWQTYDDTHLYATEKINRIKDLPNIADNFMVIVAMFDNQNQGKLRRSISDEARQAICDRIRAGGMPEQFNMFREDYL